MPKVSAGHYVGKEIGHYRLIHLLGQGGFAEVYLGEHIHLKSLAAIKILQSRLSSDHQELFVNEARTLARLLHPHITRVLDFGIERGLAFLVMEFAPRGTLRRRHPDGTRLPVPLIIDYVNQIADALQYAHNQQFIHRDMKPENILIGSRSELLLSDFGAALFKRSAPERNLQETFMGTAPYTAPEQWANKPHFATDQYALGVMAYEWLCGSRPFRGKFMEIYHQHCKTPPRPLREIDPDLSPEIERVVLRALEKDPARRYPSVSIFASELETAYLNVKRPHRSTTVLEPFSLNISWEHIPIMEQQTPATYLYDQPTLLLAPEQLRGMPDQPTDAEENKVEHVSPAAEAAPVPVAEEVAPKPTPAVAEEIAPEAAPLPAVVEVELPVSPNIEDAPETAASDQATELAAVDEQIAELLKVIERIATGDAASPEEQKAAPAREKQEEETAPAHEEVLSPSAPGISEPATGNEELSLVSDQKQGYVLESGEVAEAVDLERYLEEFATFIEKFSTLESLSKASARK
ncbi:MAG: protein kinase, partial [Ktedonobacteraceae bacterium]|nr:protein kinase [Ktedonobacteraceae bacterium]